MKDTDDESLVDGTDAGAIPATSTNHQTLAGRNVHGGKCMPEWYYYTPSEWSRSIGWGKVPEKYKSDVELTHSDHIDRMIRGHNS